jgi:hypothetical protein
MGVLMLKCPQTGQEFSTGIYLEEDSFKRLPDTVTKAACPTLRPGAQVVDPRCAPVVTSTLTLNP